MRERGVQMDRRTSSTARRGRARGCIVRAVFLAVQVFGWSLGSPAALAGGVPEMLPTDDELPGWRRGEIRQVKPIVVPEARDRASESYAATYAPARPQEGGWKMDVRIQGFASAGGAVGHLNLRRRTLTTTADRLRRNGREPLWTFIREQFGTNSLCYNRGRREVNLIFVEGRYYATVTDRDVPSAALPRVRRMHAALRAKMAGRTPPREPERRPSAPPADPLVIQPASMRTEVPAGGDVRLDIAIGNNSSGRLSGVVLSAQAQQPSVATVAEAADQVAVEGIARRLPGIPAGGRTQTGLSVHGVKPGRAKVLLLAAAEGGPKAEAVEVEIVVSAPPAPAPTPQQRKVSELFRDTMELVEVRDTRGGRFRVVSLGPLAEAWVDAPDHVLFVRPKDRYWPPTVRQWQELRAQEREASGRGGDVARGAAASTVIGYLSSGLDRACGVYEKLKAMRDLTRTETPEEVVETVQGAVLPPMAQMALRATDWVDARRDRVALEKGIEKRLGMMRGTLELPDRPPLRGFARRTPDGQWYFIELGRD